MIDAFPLNSTISEHYPPYSVKLSKNNDNLEKTASQLFISVKYNFLYQNLKLFVKDKIVECRNYPFNHVLFRIVKWIGF